ncbi:MAG TPA: hypothetical protein VH044_17500 [Polyangiaceae bacterium]|jgi:hypothetical protein|nr:hypothetical protein [Polyangiaceae bacterium]
MAPTRKSSPNHRRRESERVALKLRAKTHPTRGAGEQRRSTPRVEVDAKTLLPVRREAAESPREVIDVVTADLTKDPRHED